jgi:hypothetical protein
MMNTTFYRERLRKIRQRNEVSVALRRGNSTVNAQLMRIEIAGSRGFKLQSDAARQATQAVFILGEFDMDIERDDRLTYAGQLYQVVFIQPNRVGGTIAEAIAIQ